MSQGIRVVISGDDSSLIAAARNSAAALDQVRLRAGTAAESRASAASILEGVRGISDGARAAAAVLDEVRLSQADAAASVVAGEEIRSTLDGIGDRAAAARDKIVEMTGALAGSKLFGGGVGGGFGGKGGMFGLAGFGSLASLAGFGAEHALFTAAGLGGSVAGGAIGGGLLGLGALGTGAVGIGTNLAGSLQATKDIQSTVQATDKLSAAVQQYGRSSAQAKAAQQALNQTLAGFQPVARGAIAAAAKTAGAFGTMFRQVTGEAVKTAAQIDQQVMQVGMKFLPTIGKFAAENMKIIKQGIQPLLGWLQSPIFKGPGQGGGLGIFTNLEQIFQKNLPTSIHAMSQGFELLMKVIDVAAQHLGGFMKTLDRVFTKLNGPDFGTVASVVNKLIGLFGDLMHLVGALVRGIVDLFKPAAGVGDAIIKTLTQLLQMTDKWLSAKGTQNVLTNLFNVHLQEVIQGIFGILKAAWPILEQIVSAFLQLGTAVSKLATGPLKAVGAIIKTITKIPFASKILSWGIAIGILVKALGSMDLALGPIGLTIAAIVLVGTAVYELVKHWSTVSSFFKGVWNDIKQVFSKAWNWIKSKVEEGIQTDITQLKRWGRDILRVTEDTWNAIKAAPGKAWDWIKSEVRKGVSEVLAQLKGWKNQVIDLLKKLGSDVLGLAKTIGQHIYDGVLKPLAQLATKLWDWLKTEIMDAIHKIVGWVVGEAESIGKSITDGILRGIGNLASSLGGVLKSHLGGALHAVTSFLGIGSPSRVFADLVGKPIAQGVEAGFLEGVASLPAKISSSLRTALEAGKQAVAPFVSQYRQAFQQVMDAANQAFDAGTQKLLAAAQNNPAVQALKAFEAQFQSLNVSGPVSSDMTDAGKQLAAMQAQDQQQQLNQALQQAQQQRLQAMHQLGSDQAAKADAATILADKQAVVGAEQQVAQAQRAIAEAGLQQMAQDQANAANAKIAAMQTQADAQTSQLQNAITVQQNLQKQNLDTQLQNLQASLGSQYTTQQQAQDAIVALLQSYGITYNQVGADIGAQFAAGLASSIHLTSKAAEKLAKEIAKYLPHSPAEEGPLSKEIGWESYLLRGLPQAASKVAAAMAGLAGPGAASAFGIGAAGGGGDVYNFSFPNYVGDKQELTNTIQQQFLRMKMRGGRVGLA